jgi:hypothetical protein
LIPQDRGSLEILSDRCLFALKRLDFVEGADEAVAVEVNSVESKRC